MPLLPLQLHSRHSYWGYSVLQWSQEFFSGPLSGPFWRSLECRSEKRSHAY